MEADAEAISLNSVVPCTSSNNEVVQSSNQLLQQNNVNKVAVTGTVYKINISHTSGTVIGNQITLNTGFPQQKLLPKKLTRSSNMEKRALKMKDCQELLDEEAMSLISHNIGANFKFFFRECGFNDAKIDMFLLAHTNGHINQLSEAVYQLLLEWKRSELPTFGKTVELLVKSKVHKDCIKVLYEDYYLKKEKQKEKESG